MTLTIGTGGTRPLFRIFYRGRTAFRDVRPTSEGVVVAALPKAPSGATVCVQNRASAPLSIAGEDGAQAVVDGEPRPFALALDFFAGRERRGAEAGRIVRRIGYERGTFTGMAVGLSVATLLLGAIASAIYATWRLVG